MRKAELMEELMIAFESIRSNKLRSFLTVLGVVVGVMTVIGMVSIIRGLNQSMVGQLQSMGSNLVQFQKFEPVNFGRPSEEIRQRKPLYYEDAMAIKRLCPAIKSVSPEAYHFNVVLKYKNEETRGLAFAGALPTFDECNNLFVDEGRFLSDADIEHATNAIVIGDEIAEALFPNIDPIGKTITANGRKFKVVGKFEYRGNTFLGGSNDRYVTIPFTTFMKIFPEVYRDRGVNIATIPKSPDLVQAAIEQGTVVLRRRRGVPADKPNDFGILTPDNLIETYNQITGAIYMVMIIIASIGLMVGGIGVMNIMLVSVTERTREIGIRKAIGAKRRDILWQFLIEAVSLCAVGGVLGILAGSGISFLVDKLSPLPATVSLGAVIAGIAVSTSVGLIFGIYPANKAARQDPIVALRYE